MELIDRLGRSLSEIKNQIIGNEQVAPIVQNAELSSYCTKLLDLQEWSNYNGGCNKYVGSWTFKSYINDFKILLNVVKTTTKSDEKNKANKYLLYRYYLPLGSAVAVLMYLLFRK
jgi:hypothetical protein